MSEVKVIKSLPVPPVELEAKVDAFKPSALSVLLSDLNAKIENIGARVDIVNDKVDTFKPLLLNKTLTELKEKLESIIAIKSGCSSEHKIPALSSGTIYIAVPEERPICVIVSTLLCNDEFGSILCYQKTVASDNVLQFCVENILDRERTVSINYLYKTT
jgi:hypothetical protein